tara:strand:- start:776 stop:1075 length:300 start_codon:yes stop_codon:yes gene_type:complete
MNCKSYETFFQNFANKAKLDIMLLLRDGSLNVSALTKQLNSEQSAVSHNLKKLCDCNVVSVKSEGRERIYSLNKQTILPLLKLVQTHVESNCTVRCCKK